MPLNEFVPLGGLLLVRPERIPLVSIERISLVAVDQGKDYRPPQEGHLRQRESRALPLGLVCARKVAVEYHVLAELLFHKRTCG